MCVCARAFVYGMCVWVSSCSYACIDVCCKTHQLALKMAVFSGEGGGWGLHMLDFHESIQVGLGVAILLVRHRIPRVCPGRCISKFEYVYALDVFIYRYIHIYICVCVCVSMYVYTYEYIYMYTYMPKYINIHIYKHIYTYECI